MFTASGKAIEFAGFRRAYVEGSDDPAAELEEQETVLPKLTVGERVDRERTRGCTRSALEPKGHETAPPARYTEASLIKELERIGVGRPSTYAATIGTIERRGYVFRQGKALVPSFTAFAVTRLLREHFGDLIDVAFTAEMEEDLDQISRGEREWLDFIRQFYRGDRHHRGLEEAVKQAEERAEYPLIDVGTDPESGELIRVRIGRYGPFLQLGEGGPGKTAGVPPTIAAGRSDRREGDGADSRQGRRAAAARRRSEDRPERLRDSRPVRRLRAARRNAGERGEGEAEAVVADRRAHRIDGHARGRAEAAGAAARARHAPGVEGSRSSPGSAASARTSSTATTTGRSKRTDDLFTVDLERALELLAAPKRSARQAAEARHPQDRGARRRHALQVLEGRYGPYVTDGELNASIPKGIDPATLSLDEARALLEARRGAPPSPRRGRRAAAAPGARSRPPSRAASGRGRPRGARCRRFESEIHQGPGQGHVEGEAEGRREGRGPQARQLMGVRIVGGGLAGSEAAWQAASRGVRVTLYEMRPVRPTAVHKTDRLAELVCSNSFRGDKLDNAVGLLKEEMRRLGSLVMRAAEESRVPAGAALAVDRERFAGLITQALTDHPLVTIVREEVASIPASSEGEPVIIATGPLTSDALSAQLAAVVGRTTCISTTPSVRSCSRRRSIARRCSARRGGIGACDAARCRVRRRCSVQRCRCTVHRCKVRRAASTTARATT